VPDVIGYERYVERHGMCGNQFIEMVIFSLASRQSDRAVGNACRLVELCNRDVFDQPGQIGPLTFRIG